ncbi:hypothetical protein HDU85_000169 [Gaertneriomyces sp. JEL0708]|nr:hypothetical protein HDU85_000169 [Gaertneriomyces sp. JEL0708]
MGGGGKFPSVLFDPAIEKWYHMKENTHVYYKLNRRTGYLGIMLTLVVPGIVLLGSSYGFVSIFEQALVGNGARDSVEGFLQCWKLYVEAVQDTYARPSGGVLCVRESSVNWGRGKLMRISDVYMGAFQPLGARREEKYNFPESPKF